MATSGLEAGVPPGWVSDPDRYTIPSLIAQAGSPVPYWAPADAQPLSKISGCQVSPGGGPDGRASAADAGPANRPAAATAPAASTAASRIDLMTSPFCLFTSPTLGLASPPSSADSSVNRLSSEYSRFPARITQHSALQGSGDARRAR